MAGRPSAYAGTFRGVVGASEQAAQREVEAWRKAKLAEWKDDCWAWLTGQDFDGTYITQTLDDHDGDGVVKPFPNKEYLRQWAKLLTSVTYEKLDNGKYAHAGVVLVEKTRQMMISWATLAVMDWMCFFRPRQNMILVKNTEAEAKVMLRDKLRFLHSQRPAWLQAVNPVSDGPENRADYLSNGSYIVGVPETVAKKMGRGPSPSLVLIDEAAFHDDLRATLTTFLPSARLIVGVSTPDFGTESARTMLALLEKE